MKKKYTIGIIIILIILAIYFISNFYHCLILDLTALPEVVEKYLNCNSRDFVFLYGKGICGSCPAGRYVYSLREKREFIFFIPEDFSNNDIDNLRDSFGIKGEIVRGDIKIQNFVKKIISCANVKEFYKNIHLELGEHGKIKKIKTF